jgi:arsenite methyltransferase
LLGLGAQSRVLDLAAGRGASALHLARRYGCHVTGVDYSASSVSIAQEAAERDGLADRVRFQVGDAERLTDFADASFDAVICECAFCTFPDKPAAMREIARVLRPGGRFGLSDLTRSSPLGPELEGLLAWIACIADARPVNDYVAHCEAAGLHVEQVDEDDDALVELVRELRGRLLGARVLASLKQLELLGVEWPKVAGLVRRAVQAVEAGTLGYALLLAVKPPRSYGERLQAEIVASRLIVERVERSERAAQP